MTESFFFDELRESFERIIKCFLNTGLDDLSIIEQLVSTTQQDKENLRSTVDQAARNVLGGLLGESIDRLMLDRLLDFSILLAQKDLCSGNLPAILLSDIFDSLTLEQCQELFSLVDTRVDVWKQDLFFTYCKNQLLRSCNDLLRRLSRSQNTVFCGQILVFLARLFPLSERSGLNIISEFNADNTTLFCGDDVDSTATIPATTSDLPIQVDYNLYRKFWSLQDFFRQPNLCYSKLSWKQFISHTHDVLNVFINYKLDDVCEPEMSSRPSQFLTTGGAADPSQGDDVTMTSATTSDTNRDCGYFAKFLTNKKLLELELSDSSFRRYVLVQFLILFQYLSVTVRFKQEMFSLTEEQTTWVKNTQAQVYKLIEETPPDGVKFCECVKHILNREECWNQWKNENCPAFKEAPPMTPLPRDGRQKRKLGDDVRIAKKNGRFSMGNAEITRLWNLCPDNWAACRSEKRDFVPSMEAFFTEAIEQSDPAAQIEAQYKKVNNINFGWRALRLLAQKSPYFFTSSNQPIKSLPAYLDSMMVQLGKELNIGQPSGSVQNGSSSGSGTGNAASSTPSAPLMDDEQEYAEEERSALKKAKRKAVTVTAIVPPVESTPADTLVNAVTAAQIEAICGVVGQRWEEWAPHLGFSEDEIVYIKSEYKDVSAQARHMLTIWKEQEAKTSPEDLLEKAGVVSGLRDLIRPVL